MNINKKLIFILSCFSILSISLLYVTFYRAHHYKYSFNKTVIVNNLVPVLIIGSGPAGLSAAMYTSRAKLPTLIIAGPQPGGQLSIVRQIENWPGKQRESGKQAIHALQEQAKHFGAKILNDTVTKIDIDTWPFKVYTKSNDVFNALSIIIATGRIPKKLNIPGMKKYWGRGVGVCTICDAPFHKNQIVGVVGGGDTAVDHALQLAAYAKQVIMFVRDNELDAIETAQEYIKNNPKIKILYNIMVKEIKGDDKHVQHVTILDKKTEKIETLAMQGLYFAIGWHPNSELVQDYIKTDKKGFILTAYPSQRTNIEAIFAAGDVTDFIYGKAGVATGSGIKAGMDTIDYLQNIGCDFQTLKSHKEKIFIIKDDGSKLEEIDSKFALNEMIEKYKDKTILLDFYADFCPSCKAVMPVLHDMQKTMFDQLKILKIEINKVPNLVTEYGVKSIPFFVVIKNGKIIRSRAGAQDKVGILQLLQ